MGAGAFYRSKVYGNADAGYNKDGTPKARWVPAYWRFDAMAAYQLNKHLTAQLNVYNLLDKTYYRQDLPQPLRGAGPGAVRHADVQAELLIRAATPPFRRPPARGPFFISGWIFPCPNGGSERGKGCGRNVTP
ncbi:TonB-dependent receptor [Bordetella pertussis]|nr:TonB-dependent receptor [Bordetella pertussis]